MLFFLLLTKTHLWLQLVVVDFVVVVDAVAIVDVVVVDVVVVAVETNTSVASAIHQVCC